MRLVAVMGNARAGKDTTADYLAFRHGFVRVALADPMKRFCAEVFDFTHAQLHGDDRDKPDPRYLRHKWMLGSDPDLLVERLECLTPRFALQTLGSEWGRTCYMNVWIEYALRVAKQLLDDHSRLLDYTPAGGLMHRQVSGPRRGGVVFSDLRFKNEHEAMRVAGALMVRIRRPGEVALNGVVGHPSEEEQKSLPDALFDVVLHNDGTIADLGNQIESALIPLLNNE